MLPPFDDFGNLPPGIHLATLEEINERFGSGSPEREVESRELVDFIEWARTSGVRRIIVNGSYVTGKLAPNDVDVIVLFVADAQPTGAGSDEIQWPFLQVMFAADSADLERWALEDFGTDRRNRNKGVVEVIL